MQTEADAAGRALACRVGAIEGIGQVRQVLRRELPGAVIGLVSATVLVVIGSRNALGPLPASEYPTYPTGPKIQVTGVR